MSIDMEEHLFLDVFPPRFGICFEGRKAGREGGTEGRRKKEEEGGRRRREERSKGRCIVYSIVGVS